MKPWKEAASLILAARFGQNHSQNSTSFNYKLLCLKRHQKSKAYPGSYVFPGGKISEADTDLKWNNLFAKFNFETLFPKTNIRPQLFRKIDNELPREISLRICAIRETFEESGLLICRSADKKGSSDWVQNYEVAKSELDEWQKKVHDNADEFYNLCENYQCYPDLWALHEWANWLTPIIMKKNRFDTAFYLACIENLPAAAYEATEMEDLHWDTPQGYLDSRDEFILPPPQQYHFTQMTKINDIEALLDHGIRFNKAGVHLNFPVQVYLKDGMVLVLPGDTMYPKQVRFADEPGIDKKDMTVEEFHAISPVKNRLEIADLKLFKIKVFYIDNIDQKLSPVDSGTSNT